MWTWLKIRFTKLGRLLLGFLKVVFDKSTQLVLAQLRELALEVVYEVKNDPSIISNEDKRKAAFDRLKDAALGKGIVVYDHVINLAIELAVAYFKKKF